jgi:predicted Rossmann fold flavoprotein
MLNTDVIVIGGGAAGFFGAINTALKNPALKIVILEKSEKLLSKVKISGGGRCNVTHHCFDNSTLVKNYPRGEKELRQVFNEFNPQNTLDWFKKFGITIVAEDDGRMFPKSNSSQTIIDCFLELAKELNIKIITGFNVEEINKKEGNFMVTSRNSNNQITGNKILIACGGFPKINQFDFIKKLGHNVLNPLPSLFTFNLPGNPITQLMGLSVKNASVKIKELKTEINGPVLITHWGLSGPAILKTSAFMAKALADKNYNFEFRINWLYPKNFDEVREYLLEIKHKHANGEIANFKPAEIPGRLWEYFIYEVLGIEAKKKWRDLSAKELNQLNETLFNQTFNAKGKTTFKEEFVTCGGVDLKEINLKTMESKLLPQLYFAGEVINVDGITGGFNFQNAWSTSYIASEGLSK